MVVTSLVVRGAVGQGPGIELLTWLAEADLPDPEEVLADPSSFVLPERGDRAFAALSSVAAAVAAEPTNERWSQGWVVFGRAAVTALDIAAAASRALVRCRPPGAPVPPEIERVHASAARRRVAARLRPRPCQCLRKTVLDRAKVAAGAALCRLAATPTWRVRCSPPPSCLHLVRARSPWTGAGGYWPTPSSSTAWGPRSSAGFWSTWSRTSCGTTPTGPMPQGVPGRDGRPMEWNRAADAEVNDDSVIGGVVPRAPRAAAGPWPGHRPIGRGLLRSRPPGARQWDCGSGCDGVPRLWDVGSVRRDLRRPEAQQLRGHE